MADDGFLALTADQPAPGNQLGAFAAAQPRLRPPKPGDTFSDLVTSEPPAPHDASFNTVLSPLEETQFQKWKAKNAPNDSGADYDLRGAFKAGLSPAANGHWPDTFKKPNHPTFSNESKYANEAPERAGRWDGETYLPPGTPLAKGDKGQVKGFDDLISNTPTSDSRSQLEKGFMGGLVGANAKMAGDAFEGFGVLLDRADLQDLGKNVSAFGKGDIERNIGDVPSVADVRTDDPGNFLSDVGKLVQYQFGNAVGTSMPSLVTGIAAASVTKSPIVGLVGGALAPSYIQNFGDVYGSAKEDPGIAARIASGNLSPKQLAATAAVAAVPIAALDAISLGFITDKVLFGQAKRRLVGRVVNGILTGAITEGSTEGLQEVISQWAQVELGSNTEWTTKVIAVVDNALGGALAGVGFGALGSASSVGLNGQPKPRGQPAPAGAPIAPGVGAAAGAAINEALSRQQAPAGVPAGATPADAVLPEVVGEATALPPDVVKTLKDFNLTDEDIAALKPEDATRLAGEFTATRAERDAALAKEAKVSPTEPALVPAHLEDLVSEAPQGPPPDEKPAPIVETDLTTAQPPAVAPGTRAAPVVATEPEHVAAAGTAVNPEPTPAQVAAGNYSKGHIDLQGLGITIENPEGSTRAGTAPDGTPWSVTMPAAYGYVKRTTDNTGEQVDVYVGPDPKSDKVFVVDQVDHQTQAFDEPKAMLGFADKASALATYQKGFSDGKGAARVGGVTEMSVAEFKGWLKAAATEHPSAYVKAKAPAEKNTAAKPEKAPAATKPEKRATTKPSDKPTDIIRAIISAGGIKDSGAAGAGDLRAMGAYKRPGLINNKRGKTPDYMREHLAQLGFFDQQYGAGEGSGQSTVADFMDLVSRGLGGEKIYSPQQQPLADAAAETSARQRSMDDARRAIEEAVEGDKSDPELVARAIEINMERGGDPVDALEAAAIELYNAEATPAQKAKVAQIAPDLPPGWDNDTRATVEGGQRGSESRPQESPQAVPPRGKGATEERGVEGKPQGVIPGAEQRSADLAKRKAAQPLKPKADQKLAPGGPLFTAEEDAKQGDLLAAAPKAPPKEPPKPALSKGSGVTASRPPGRIEDAGAKIGGARKDRWRERGLTLDDLAGMTPTEEFEHVKKDNVWKTPDYQALIAGGVEPQAAAAMKLMRDRLAAKPKKDSAEERRRYIETVTIIRDEVMSAKKLDDLRGLQERVLGKLGWKEEDRRGYQTTENRSKLFAAFTGRSAKFNLHGYDEQRRIAKMLAEGWPKSQTREKGGSETGEPKIPERPHLDTIKRTGREVRGDRDVTSQDFIKDFGFRGVEFGNWVASDERQKTVNLAYEALHDLADVMSVPPRALSLGDSLALAFGARGSGAARAHYEAGRMVINMTKLSGAGSLAHEWAHALDHYFGTLNLEGGSRGKPQGASGWYDRGDYSGKPKDRFDRTTGARTEETRLSNLRPEMARAFDRVMNTLFEKNRTKAEAVRRQELEIETAKGRIALTKSRITAATDPKFIAQSKDYLEQVEKALAAGERRLGELRGNPNDTDPSYGVEPTSYSKEAQHLVGKSVSGYWTRPTEMFARAFEAYVQDKVEMKEGVSQYLVHGTTGGVFTRERGFKGDPYPAGAEREAFDAAFDNLVQTMEATAEESGAVRLGNIYAGPVRSKLAPKQQKALETKLRALVKRIAGNDVKVWTFDTINAESVGDPAYQQGMGRFAETFKSGRLAPTAGGEIKGFWDGTAIVKLALRDPLYDPVASAYHEPYHRVEMQLMTDAEFELVQSAKVVAQARSMAALEVGLNPKQAEALPGYEARAIAFERYARLRDAGKPIHLTGFPQPLARLLEKIWRAVREMKQWLLRQGFTSLDDVFDAAYEGAFADRANAGFRQTRDLTAAGATTPKAPVFYSAVLKTVEDSKTGKASGAQWLATLKNAPGIKAEEMEWLGLEDWLKAQTGPVTREALADFVRGNQLEVQETELRGDRGVQNVELSELRAAHPDAFKALDEAGVEPVLSPDHAEIRFAFREEEWTARELDEANEYGSLTDEYGLTDAALAGAHTLEDNFRVADFGGAKFEQYSLPGGKGYRELLLQVPPKRIDVAYGEPHPFNGDGKAMWEGRRPAEGVTEYPFTVNGQEGTITHWPSVPSQRRDEPGLHSRFVINSAFVQNSHWSSLAAAKGYLDKVVNDFTEAGHSGQRAVRNDVFTGGHFTQPNVVVHVRFNERTDAAGKRTLFLEEIQSDWHKQGRKKGYAGVEDEAFKEQIDAARKALLAALRKDDNLGFDEAEQARAEIMRNPNWRRDFPDVSPETIAAAEAYLPLQQRHMANKNGVPDAPFKVTWHELAFKRMVRYAAENGYDQIAWTPGIEQVKRYEAPLRERVKAITWAPSVGLDAGGISVDIYVRRKDESYGLLLDERGVVTAGEGAWMGKPIEDVVGKEIARRIVGEKSGHIEGGDIVIGGKGYSDLYDKALVKLADKIGGKFGAKVGSTTVLLGQIKTYPDDPGLWYVQPPNGAKGGDGPFDSQEAAVAAASRKVHSLPITEAMRDGVIAGQPLFNRRPATQTEDETAAVLGNIVPDAAGNPFTDSAELRQDALKHGLEIAPFDRIMRLPFDIFGGRNQKGEWKPGQWLSKKSADVITNAKFDDGSRFGFLNPILHKVRAGLVDRYGLPEEYVARDRERALQERAMLADVPEIMKALSDASVGTAEAKVLHAILTGEHVPTEDWKGISEPIRNAIDSFGAEAVELGLISPESFERNRGKYLHRVYLKHENDQTGLARWVGSMMSTRRKKIIGNQLKGRGLWKEVPFGRIGDGATLGATFEIFDKVNAEGKVTAREYVQKGGTPPEGYTSRGMWEVRGKKGGNVILWRDWTKAEREKMGEINDARYTIAKTYMLMAHDLAVGRFYKDISENADWTSASEPQGTWKEPGDYKPWQKTFDDVEWIHVPDTMIPKSGTKRYAALAGKWVRSEIWRDLNELEQINRPNVWQKLLTQWKLNKTSRSPVVHMNNVMSNFVLMDMSGVGVSDLAVAIRSYVKSDATYEEANHHGAFGADMASQEIRREVLDPLLKEIARDVQGGQSMLEAKFGLLGKLANAIWSAAKFTDRKMIDLYRLEDEVFRMALYMRRRAQGVSAQEAADEARQQFVDYDIRAPWVNMARRTVLPFIAYTYRAVPLVARTVMTRPWKIAKYAAIAYAANALAYMLFPGDEDEERRSMREDIQGMTWLGAPRMLRLPFGDNQGNPMFFDIRRWIPAGDVFDMNAGVLGDLGVPAPLQFGGPLMLGAELALNKQAFTQQPIWNSLTDDWWDKASKVSDWAWKAWVPSAAWVPGSWYWEKVGNALKGARDWSGQAYELPAAVASSLGVKVQSQDVQDGFRVWGLEFDRIERDLRSQMGALGRDYQRGMISETEFEAQRDRLIGKVDALAAKQRRVFTGEDAAQ